MDPLYDVELVAVTKRYGSSIAVDSISLRVPKAGAEALIAARSLVGSLRRTSVLVGALSTAIAMLAAVVSSGAS